MNWFVYVIMAGLYSDGTQDTYLFTNPVLPSLEACQEYVYVNSNAIRMELMTEFDGKSIERVFCIEEEKLKKYLETVTQQDGTSI